MLEIDEEEGYTPDLEIFMVKLVGLQDEWRKMRSAIMTDDVPDD